MNFNIHIIEIKMARVTQSGTRLREGAYVGVFFKGVEEASKEAGGSIPSCILKHSNQILCKYLKS